MVRGQVLKGRRHGSRFHRPVLSSSEYMSGLYDTVSFSWIQVAVVGVVTSVALITFFFFFLICWSHEDESQLEKTLLHTCRASAMLRQVSNVVG